MSKTLLLVEDEAILAMSEKMALEQYGYAVKTVTTGEKAVEAVKTCSEIDLILMDINLGKGIDGTQAAEIILKKHDIPIVFVSSHSEREIVEKTEKITSYGYVVKASSITVLDASIKMAFKLFDAKQAKKREEAIIQENEEKYRGLVEGIPGIVYSFSSIRGGIYYSSQTTSILGFTPGQLYSQPLLWHSSIHPDDQPRVDQAIREIESGKPFQLEYRMRDVRGSWHWLEDRSLRYQKEGEEILIEGFAIDITEKKKSEIAIKDAAWRLEGIVEGTQVGTWEWNVQTGETAFNSKWAEIIGYSLDELAPISIKTWETLAHPDDLKQSEELLGRHFSGELPFYKHESRMKHKDGHWVWVSDRGKVLTWTDDGKPAMMFGTHTDITERKRMETILLESKEKYSAAFSTSPYAITITRPKDGLFIEVNDAFYAMLGFSHEETENNSSIGMNLWVDEKDRNYVTRELADGNQVVGKEFAFRKKNGETMMGVFSAHIIKINNDSFILSSINDITERKNAEEALRESEGLFKSVVQNSSDLTILTDQEGRITYLSPQFENVIGHPSSKFLGQLMPDIIHPDDITKCRQEWVKVYQHRQEALEFEYRIIDREGNVRWVSHNARMLIANGNTVGMQNTIRNITKRKEAENASREIEERYRTLIENTGEGIGFMDTEERFVFANSAAEIIFGVESGGLNGVNLDRFVSAEQFESVKKETGLRVLGEKSVYELSILRPDGEKRDIIVTAVPRIGKDNAFSGTYGVFRDNTNRKLAEEALRDSDRRLRRLAENARVMIYRMSLPSGRYEYVSPASSEIFGFAPDDFYNGTISISKIVHNDFIGFFNHEWQNLLMGKMPPSYEYKINHKDGSERWLFQSNVLVSDENGMPLSIEGIVSDITEKKIVEDRINALLAEKELILKEVHHRVKNNLNTIVSLLSLQAQMLVEPSAKSALEDTGRRVRSLMKLYEKLYQSVDCMNVLIKDYLPALVDEIIGNFPNCKNVKVESVIQDFILDAKRLQPLGIIINELLTNIMKYAFVGRTEGAIIVSATNSEGHIAISVADNGNGMPESISLGDSPGFGLQLVRALTQQLEGTIRIERGNGTRIVLEFNN